MFELGLFSSGSRPEKEKKLGLGLNLGLELTLGLELNLGLELEAGKPSVRMSST